MADDVMARLMAVQPMPRGERLATWCENSWLDALPSHRLWVRLSEYGLLSDLAFVFDDSPQDHAAAAVMVLRKASPLRRCRELIVVERETSDRLRNALDKYGRHRVYCPMFPECTCGFDEARR
jgi:hypothetical protein